MSTYRIPALATAAAALVVVINAAVLTLGQPVPQPGATMVERFARVDPVLMPIGAAVFIFSLIVSVWFGPRTLDAGGKS